MASNPQHEPTMEEILASIRKIISEDSSEAAVEAAPAPQPAAPASVPTPPAPAAVPTPAPQAAAPAPAPASEPEDDADVLELTQEVREEPAPAPVAPDDVVFQAREESAEPAPAPEGIFSDKSRQALDDTFANLESLDAEEPAAHIDSLPAIDGSTVEAVFERAVRGSFEPVLREWLADNADPIVEKMTPIIRDWLDEHFPALLEDAVRGEVDRVVKARKR